MNQKNYNKSIIFQKINVIRSYQRKIQITIINSRNVKKKLSQNDSLV